MNVIAFASLSLRAGGAYRLSLLSSLLLTFICVSPSDGAWAQSGPTLERTAAPAAGRQTTGLQIPQFGRYAVTVKSAEGVSLQLVDRAAGPGDVSGAPGESDGRLDVFLDRGQYRLVTVGHPRATGSAELTVSAFSEKNAPQPPALVELKTIQAELKDLQQLSYWLEVKQPSWPTGQQERPILLEAAGRSLADLRIWKDGAWLVDAAPETQVVQPTTGRPLMTCRLSVSLAPGLYLVTAYGGKPQPWSEESAEHPFYLRCGIPSLGNAGRSRHVTSPFGVDRFAAPGKVTYFRLELPTQATATMQIGRAGEQATFEPQDPGQWVITKDSRIPVAEASLSSDSEGARLITVTAAAGQPYILQYFDQTDYYAPIETGPYWVSTTHSGSPADSIDATGLLTEHCPGAEGYLRPLMEQVVTLNQKTAFRRRFNLLEAVTLFFRVTESGAYKALTTGVDAKVTVEPLAVNAVGAPPKRVPASALGWDLEAGYYVLRVAPAQRGIVELELRPGGLVNSVLDYVGLGAEFEGATVRPSIRFPAVKLNSNCRYRLYVNRQPGVVTGLVVRRLPLDLSDPLPVSQTSADVVSVPFQVNEASVVKAEAEDGASLEVSIDGGAWERNPRVEPGTHSVAVRHSQSQPVQYSLTALPVRMEASTPLPAMPDASLAALPKFPALAEENESFFNLERQATTTFLLQAERPALYRVESTGLLATAGALRSRTIPSFARASENGVGRNFSIQQYLSEGDYQVTVSADGESAGHLGIRMSRTPLVNGGFLTSWTPARVTLSPGQAVAYYFVITNPGEFRVRAVGFSRTINCRLEDRDGWPLLKPNIPADITQFFTPGTYRVILLPQATAARIITLIEPTPRPRRFKGHGPHRLPPATSVEHVWMEPSPGEPRTPDTWEVDLPADVDLTVELSNEMQATVSRANAPDTPLGQVIAGRPWRGNLPAGRYRIDVSSLRINNRALYRITVSPDQLVAGLTRDVSAPEEIPVSVGPQQLVEFSSFGPADVKARLLDSERQIIESADDRPDDWNFQIRRELAPGKYWLKVDPVGTARASCSVSMRAPEIEEKTLLTLPVSSEIKLGRKTLVYPLAGVVEGQMLLLSAKSPEALAVSVEARANGGRWIPMASAVGVAARLEIPIQAGSTTDQPNYRLVVWTLNRRDTVAQVNAICFSAPVYSESALASGVSLETAPGFSPPTAVARINLERPGLLRLADTTAQRWSSGWNRACAQPESDILAAATTSVWVAGDPGRTQETTQGVGKAVRVQATRRPVSAGAEPVQFLVRADEGGAADVASPPEQSLVIIASSRAGLPVARLLQGSEPAPVAVTAHASLSAKLKPAAPVVVIDMAERSPESADVRLEALSLRRAEAAEAQGVWTGAVSGLESKAYKLPGGLKRIRLTVGAGTAAALSKEGRESSIHWVDGEAFAERLETDADLLTLLHLREGTDYFTIEAIPLAADQASLSLSPEAPYEAAQTDVGLLRLSVRPGMRADGERLHVRGAYDSVTFLGASGRVSFGPDISVSEPGEALISHRPGTLLCWFDSAGREAASLWGQAPRPEAREVKLPASLALSGPSESIRLVTSTPRMLHFRTAVPVVTMLGRPGDSPEVEVHEKGALLDVYLPAGSTDLLVRAIGGGPLSGIAELTASPVDEIGEGLGPESELGPGGARLFSFRVERAGPVGIGVRADQESVEATLMDSRGHTLGKGFVQMPNLKPGIYLLSLRNPSEHGPVKARPALAGLVLPSTAPPLDVIKSYVAPDTETPSFTSARALRAPVRQIRSVEDQDVESSEDEGAEAGEDDQETPEEQP